MSRDVRWVAEHRVDGVLLGRVGRSGDDLVAEWTGVARLLVRRDGSDVRFLPEPGASPEDVEKVRRGSANLLVRHARGHLALHGAAVAIGGRAVGLFGAAEAGKSTLAASLCLTRGAQLLADDAIALERTPLGFDVIGLEVDHWLDGGSRLALGLDAGDSGKRPLRATPSSVRRARLAALVHLSFARGGDVRLVPLAGVEAFAALVGQVVRFVVDEPDPQRGELEHLATIEERVPVLRLERPRDLRLLVVATTLVADLLGSP